MKKNILKGQRKKRLGKMRKWCICWQKQPWYKDAVGPSLKRSRQGE